MKNFKKLLTTVILSATFVSHGMVATTTGQSGNGVSDSRFSLLGKACSSVIEFVKKHPRLTKTLTTVAGLGTFGYFAKKGSLGSTAQKYTRCLTDRLGLLKDSAVLTTKRFILDKNFTLLSPLVGAIGIGCMHILKNQQDIDENIVKCDHVANTLIEMYEKEVKEKRTLALTDIVIFTNEINNTCKLNDREKQAAILMHYYIVFDLFSTMVRSLFDDEQENIDMFFNEFQKVKNLLLQQVEKKRVVDIYNKLKNHNTVKSYFYYAFYPLLNTFEFISLQPSPFHNKPLDSFLLLESFSRIHSDYYEEYKQQVKSYFNGAFLPVVTNINV